MTEPKNAVKNAVNRITEPPEPPDVGSLVAPVTENETVQRICIPIVFKAYVGFAIVFQTVNWLFGGFARTGEYASGIPDFDIELVFFTLTVLGLLFFINDNILYVITFAVSIPTVVEYYNRFVNYHTR